MGTIKRFEDIKAWQEGRKLATLVYDMTRVDVLAKDFGMRDQIFKPIKPHIFYV